MKARWSSDEVDTLRTMYPNSTRTEIAAVLGRTTESVKSYSLKVLGLRKGGKQRTLAGHFEHHVRARPASGCWEWCGSVRADGYGSISGGYGYWTAHRLSMYLHNGRLPRNLDVLHTCDNRKCVRPSHLYIGTDFDNQRDRAERLPRILTASDVIGIRKEHILAGVPWKVIAERWPKAHPLTIKYAARGRSWKWLPMPGDARWEQYVAAHQKSPVGTPPEGEGVK